MIHAHCSPCREAFAAFASWEWLDKLRPRLRSGLGRTALFVEPPILPRREETYAAEDNGLHRLGMSLRIGEGESCAPTPTCHCPSCQAEMDSQSLQIVDEIPGGIVLQGRV